MTRARKICSLLGIRGCDTVGKDVYKLAGGKFVVPFENGLVSSGVQTQKVESLLFYDGR